MGAPGSSFALVSSPLMHGWGDIIAQYLIRERGVAMPHHKMEYTAFANGELLPQIPESVRRQHVFFVHALQYPDPNTALMTMFLTNDAMQRASVDGITLVLPYIPYLRQDRKDKPRVPISARTIADLVESNRAVKQLITIDMHAEQEQGFFSIPVDNLSSVRPFSEHILDRFGTDTENIVLLAADFGGVVRTRRLAEELTQQLSKNIAFAMVEKRRVGPNKATIAGIIGASVAGARVIIGSEDIIDTGGTLREVINFVIGKGALEVVTYATHGIFSNNAEQYFAEHNFWVGCTDSIPRSPEYYAANSWLTKIPIAQYFAEAIFEATQPGGSISKLSTSRRRK